jgi:hypothetical protein
MAEVCFKFYVCMHRGRRRGRRRQNLFVLIISTPKCNKLTP